MYLVELLLLLADVNCRLVVRRSVFRGRRRRCDLWCLTVPLRVQFVSLYLKSATQPTYRYLIATNKAHDMHHDEPATLVCLEKEQQLSNRHHGRQDGWRSFGILWYHQGSDCHANAPRLVAPWLRSGRWFIWTSTSLVVVERTTKVIILATWLQLTPWTTAAYRDFMMIRISFVQYPNFCVSLESPSKFFLEVYVSFRLAWTTKSSLLYCRNDNVKTRFSLWGNHYIFKFAVHLIGNIGLMICPRLLPCVMSFFRISSSIVFVTMIAQFAG